MSTSPQAETAMTAQAGDVLLVIRTYNTTTVGELLGRELLPTKSPTLVRIMRLTSARMNPRLDDFRARSPDELSMTKGDRIELIERDEDFNDGWYLGRHPPTGATGLFPLVYTTLATPLPTRTAPALASPRAGISQQIPQMPEQPPPPPPPPPPSPSPPCNSEESIDDSPNRSPPSQSPSQDRRRPSSAASPLQQSIPPPPVPRPTTLPSSGAIQPMGSNDSTPSASAVPDAPRPLSLGSTTAHHAPDEESPVMHETLTVIDEHITHMHTPRQSLSAVDRHGPLDSASDYSSLPDHRLSSLAANEMDDDDDAADTDVDHEPISQAGVLRWTPFQVGEHLRRLGVQGSHCDTFVEQEISGEVLLGMDQASLFLKEFDLGSIGRRLRTWQVIKSLQQEAGTAPRQARSPMTDHTHFTTATPTRTNSPTSTLTAVGTPTPTSLSRTRSSAMTTVLPRIPSLTEQAHPWRESDGRPVRQPPPPFSSLSGRDGQTSGPPSSSYGSYARPGSPRRPSAASVRELHHSRRPSSSVDVGASSWTWVSHDGANGSSPSPVSPSSVQASATGFSHQKQASFDRSWTMGAATARLHSRPQSVGDGPIIQSRPGPGRAATETMTSNPPTPADLDRGYFSQGETDTRRTRNMMRKRGGGGHLRNSSSIDEPHHHRLTASNFRHSRFGSADAIREPGSSTPTTEPPPPVPPTTTTTMMTTTTMTTTKTMTATRSPTSPAAQAYYGRTSAGHFRRGRDARPSSSLPLPPPKDASSPTVTKLEPISDNGRNMASPSLPSSSSSSSVRTRQVSALSQRPIRELAIKLRPMAPRVVSDAVTSTEKAGVVKSPATSLPSPVQSPTLTGSSTPSGPKSFELESADPGQTISRTGSTKPLGSTGTIRRKSKKETSAYIRGLEKKPPREQMIGCDYSGWMKKKSSNLMTTWKTRLFVLRGRRLSYYYTDTDEQEQGLIDITAHRVLPADDDRITGLHATLTGATHTPTTPVHPQTPTRAATDAAAAAAGAATTAPSNGVDSTFIFKLVPPRPGFSRAVHFTRPTVHYFAVDNVQIGRRWMAALMKATIDRDDATPASSTFGHPTISLVKAQQMRHRPPALMGLDEDAEGEASEDEDDVEEDE